ncbi:hypothetical protein F2P47_17295 [Parvibaculum sedimenti]|uniref:RepB-like DNA primase domain-containing protein n=1 Tax=Parvibaculum sedimenti TaxID=2608632 RepID=A0A6N6VCK8_9HYPH|nr:hypothetical protein [Parvibaculum sedimenti]KAB7738416.1 hypothetical protein F2P47_17295 [Parvibaculum sedimenti]
MADSHLPDRNEMLHPDVVSEHADHDQAPQGRDDTSITNAGMTDLSTPLLETAETDETYSVSNKEFMQAIFHKQPDGASPAVVSFAGHPGHVSASEWGGKPWRREADELEHLSAAANNYFSLSTHRPEPDGKIRRRKSCFSALHAVMLDDVGTKVPFERLNVPPSWLIQTSPGNYQAGYILRDPIDDTSKADQLMKAIISKGLCDPGAGGPTARLARLPVATNGKHTPLFKCRLSKWAPGRLYTVGELIEGFQLDIKPLGRAGSATPHYSRDDNSVLTLPPEENAILKELGMRGWLKGNPSAGKHEITCPWVTEHTDGIDSGTAYFEPSAAHPQGGFKCLHGHCAERHLIDLLKELGLDESAARSKATIRVEPGNIHLTADAAEQVLATSGRFFQNGHRIVEIATDPGTGQVSMRLVEMSELIKVLAEKVDWLKYDASSKQMHRIDPPSRALMVLHESRTFKHLPVLKGLANQPYFRADLSLVRNSGYDAASCIYGVFDDQAFFVSANPTKEDAIAALNELKDIVSEYCFVSDIDRAAALAGMLTATLRTSLPQAPLLHSRGCGPGTGKSHLNSVLTAFATPQISAPLSFATGESEFQKKLFAELLTSPAVINFDNLTSDLIPHNCFCTALTSEYISDRILKSSRTITVGTRTLMLSSGNNVGPVRDLARRTITINLDPRCEMPAMRSFARPNLLEEIRRRRTHYVSLALTIVHAWVCAGKPITDCRAFSGYEMWSQLCRQPLLWLDECDPVKSVIQALAEDPDREMLRRLHLCWQYEFGDYGGTVRQLLNPKAPPDGESLELQEVIHEIAGERDGINHRRLGKWIARHAGQVVDGLYFEKARSKRSVDVWLLRKRE